MVAFIDLLFFSSLFFILRSYFLFDQLPRTQVFTRNLSSLEMSVPLITMNGKRSRRNSTG